MTIITILLLILLGFKIYFEVDHFFYQKRLKELLPTTTQVKVKTPITTQTLKMDGYDLHYYVAGADNQETLIFLHPAFSNHRAFDQQIDFFADTYKVITIDLIGHGLSQVKQSKDKIDISSAHLLKIMELEQVEQAHMVGVSMGALVAQYFGFQHPEKVKSLTTLGAYDIHEKNEEVEKAQQSLNMSIGFRVLFSINAFRKKIADMTCASEKGKALFYESTAHFTRKSLGVMQGLQNVIQDRANIQPPYPNLILIGDLDLELAKRLVKTWHKELNNSELVIIENAGHCANIDQPDAFNQQLKDFLAKHKN